jgi:GNAT superfamily N-acetyltransferase
MTVTVRRATREDAESIAKFAVALFELHVEWDATRFTQIATREGAEWFYGDRTESSNAAVIVAELEGAVIGFAFMQFEPTLYAELAVKVLWLHDIYVEPEHRHSNAGEAMVAEIREIAKGFGANKVLLTVAAKNTGGAEFFADQGFRTTMHEMMLSID